MKYCVLAYYVISEVADPQKEASEHRKVLSKLDSRGRIYISQDGINAQLSLLREDVEPYLAYLKKHPLFHEADVKIHDWHEHAFEKLRIKLRPQLVAVDQKVDFSKRGTYLLPSEWAEMMEKRDENTIVIDVRNQYESRVGHFEGALKPDLETFREFPEYAANLAKSHDLQKTKVMMYCTGGIRCEYFSALMKEKGFESVFHLKGGVIRYGNEEGRKHWKGKLFVFDDRMNVPIDGDEREVIASCHFCNEKNDTFYNCANMDCNALFTACPKCISENRGCCSEACQTHGRVRPFCTCTHPKPFRKLSAAEKKAL